jgi:hypothetical protein
MARPGLLNHPKFKRLVHELGAPRPHVLGYLELLWTVGYEGGNPYLGDPTDVELAAEWEGEPGRLFQALLDCRFIDAIGNDKYQIHDLLENAPDYVRKRAQRDAERRNKDLGACLSAERRSLSAERQHSQPSPAQPSQGKNPLGNPLAQSRRRRRHPGRPPRPAG